MAKKAKTSKSKKKTTRSKKTKSGTIREAIRKEVAARGLTGYQMVEALRGKVSRTAVYRFLSDGGTTDVATAEAFLEVLDLTVAKK